MVSDPSEQTMRTMTCRNVVERTTMYLEDCLQASARAGMDSHLASCAGCRTYVKQIALVREMTALLPRPVPPPQKQARLRRYFVQRRAPLQQPEQFGYGGDDSNGESGSHHGV